MLTVDLVLGPWIVAGAVLAHLQMVFGIELGSVSKTYGSWLWMAPLAAAVIFAGRATFIIGVTVLALFSLREFARVSGLERHRSLTAAVGLGIIDIALAALIDANVLIALIIQVA